MDDLSILSDKVDDIIVHHPRRNEAVVGFRSVESDNPASANLRLEERPPNPKDPSGDEPRQKRRRANDGNNEEPAAPYPRRVSLLRHGHAPSDGAPPSRDALATA